MEAIYQYLIVFITAIFVNNVVLSQILGICPFLGVSKKINTDFNADELLDENGMSVTKLSNEIINYVNKIGD